MYNDTLAKQMYDAYCEAVGGVAFNGDPLPKSDEFFSDETKLKQVNAWRAAAEIPYAMIHNLTSNLGHPAYNLSSSTTIAIDELREKTFDYLGVPND